MEEVRPFALHIIRCASNEEDKIDKFFTDLLNRYEEDVKRKAELDARNEYECEHCRGVFPKGWSDAECEAEARALHGYFDKSMMAQICDDCFQIMAKRYKWEPKHQ